MSCHTTSGPSAAFTSGSYPEPSPTAFQSTILGTGVHGTWLEVSTTSAIIGARPGLPYSRCWNCDSVYWSGIGDQLKFRPL